MNSPGQTVQDALSAIDWENFSKFINWPRTKFGIDLGLLDLTPEPTTGPASPIFTIGSSNTDTEKGGILTVTSGERTSASSKTSMSQKSLSELTAKLEASLGELKTNRSERPVSSYLTEVFDTLITLAGMVSSPEEKAESSDVYIVDLPQASRSHTTKFTWLSDPSDSSLTTSGKSE